MSYKQLSASERQQIFLLRYQQHLSLRAIAQKLARSASTISRELQRNHLNKLYLPDTAHTLARYRRAQSKTPFLKVSEQLLGEIKHGLHHFHSPEQIRGRLKLAGKAYVSHETIYKMIYADHAGMGAYQKYLRQGRRERQKRGGSNQKRGQIPGRIDIDERPVLAGMKVEIGHWEGDTVIGANYQGGLVTLVDKCSKYLLAGLIRNRRSSLVRKVSERLLKSVPREYAKTVTFDNGKEFSQHQKLSEAVGIACYFAKPYHSWERGLNEHTNGLVRQFFGKKTNFLIVKPEQLQRVVDLLNDRPRKSLGYRTPREVFLEQSGCVALQT
ncbi:IS30 family transposase [Gloeobacter kilaueensis]|uniref:Transposase n=1 Tax=Gloeobacter kilaueensis (strain ATCC BAA-2537 / CCAP 1431/1 / ULC 316 / JS1) TaxID=1183438 RepID=U5QGG7_GLOK1|nr:IS30 family transposase [Gloeobacter kilaueensis]AGY57963.1 transposase [Gloeobacter kilaueensis JS1]